MRSVAELSTEANSYEFSTAISFRSWIHVSQTLFREARLYDADKHYERAFVLYLRYADLILNRLQLHPDADKNSKSLSEARQRIPAVIEAANQLKIILKSQSNSVAAVEAYTIENSQDDINGLEEGRIESPKVCNSREVDLSGFEMLRELNSRREIAEVQTTPRFEYPVLLPNEAARNDQQPAHIEQGPLHVATDQLRKLFFPRSLRHKFLDIARTNTVKNIETAGILGGKLNRNAFFVTHLVVPDQEGTANTVQTTNEEELFDFIEGEGLFILGWIHTHPRQTCFMSSVDLHTHTGYQIMLPEAVAIVLAPTGEPDWGVFRLTDPPGIDVIKACKLRGFHPHSEPNIYSPALRPGHAMEVDYKFTTTDLRTT